MPTESNCCQAPPLGEIDRCMGMCSDCKEWAVFNPDCPECGSDDTQMMTQGITKTHWECSACNHSFTTDD